MQQENRENATGIQAEARDNSTVHVAETINIYESSRPPRGVPFQALALPKDYVDRPEIRQKIKFKLIDCSVSRPGTLVVSAIYGLGGVGKSVMAAALAHDREVQDVCGDGVLWVTLGQNPDLLPCLYGWVQALGDYDFNPTTIDSASSHLRSLLRDKKMLLVVDDAWQSDHVTPFQVGGEGCRVLVTTREAHVHDAERIDMEVMSEAEALELLLSKAQVKLLTVEEEEKAKQLIGAVGGLPLAVDLAGAQIADGLSWDELLRDLEAEIAYLESLDRPNAEGVRDEKTRKRLSLKASLNLSLKILTAEQLQQFAWLGVLPEDVSIQPDMAATLWSVSQRQAGAILRTFRAKSLLLSGVQGIGQASNYRLHDLMHDLARGLLTREGEKAIPGLNIEFKGAHAILLDRYLKQTRDGQWHTLTDDGYIYSHLTWHMEQAGRIDELHLLFQEVTSEGRNGWYEACDRVGQMGTFVTDINRAWRLAESFFIENPRSAIVLQVRYTFILSTLNSLASNIPAKLIATLVEKNVWTPAQGLAYAQHMQKPHEQLKCIAALAPYTSKSLFPEILKLARGIQDEFCQAYALNELTKYWPEIAPEALEVISKIKDESSRESALSDLAKYLPENLFPQALELVNEIEDESSRERVLSTLVKYISPQLMPRIFEIVRKIQNEYYRFQAVNHLSEYLTEEYLPEILEVASDIQNEFLRADTLIIVTKYLPKNLLLEVVKLAREMQHESTKASVLIKISEYLPEITLEALEVTRRIQDESNRSEAINSLVNFLPEELMPDALEVIRTINHRDCYHPLRNLVKYLPKNMLPEALEVAREIQDINDRVSTLMLLAKDLPEKNLIFEALGIVRNIRDDFNKVRAFSIIVENLPDVLLGEALDIAREIQREYCRCNALAKLAQRWPEIASEAVDTILEIQDISDQTHNLSELMKHLPEKYFLIILEELQEIQDDTDKSVLLEDLIKYLPIKLLPEALNILRRIQNLSDRANAFVIVSQQFPEIVPEALDILNDIKNDDDQSRLLNELVEKIPNFLLPKALRMMCKIQDDFPHAKALIDLVKYLPAIAPEALDTVQKIQDDSDRANALSRLVKYLPELASEALNLISRIEDDFHKSNTLTILVAYLPKNRLSQALFEINEIQDIADRANVLSRLIEYLPELAWEVFEVIHGIKENSQKVHVLNVLTKFLPKDLLPEVLKLVDGIKDKSYRANVLVELIEDFPEVASELLEMVQENQSSEYDKYHRALILSRLIQHFPELTPEALDAAQKVRASIGKAIVLKQIAQTLPESWFHNGINITRRIQDHSDRADILSSLMLRIKFPLIKIELFHEILHSLALCGRRDFFEIFPKLAPTIIELGDYQTLDFSVYSIRDVCEKWR
jgi:hypothetical protein